jgi:hypothetical protein
MKTIVRYFHTLQQAEDFQFDLYSQYESVQLIGFPTFTEEGKYTWHVKGPI